MMQDVERTDDTANRNISDKQRTSVRFIHDFGETLAAYLLLSHWKERQVNTLQCMEHALAQQRETRAAITLPLDQFELVHESFSLPVGIDERQPSEDFFVIPLQPGDETLKLSEAAHLDLLYPVLKLVPTSIADDLSKRLSKLM